MPLLGINALQVIGIVLPLILLFVCLIKKLDAAQPPVFFLKNRLTNYYLLFLIFCLPAVIVSNEPILIGGDWLRYFTLWAILLFSINFLSTKDDISQVFIVVIISSIYPLSRFIIDFIMGNSVVIGGVSRYIGGYQNMIDIASLLLCFLPAYLYFIYKQQNKIIKYFLIGCTIFLLFCIMQTYFRTIIIAIVSLIFLLLLLRKQYVMLGSLTLLLVIATIFSPTIQAKFSPAISTLMHLDSLLSVRPTRFDTLMSDRFGMYRHLITTFIHKGSLATMFHGFGYHLPLKMFWVNNAHNGFLQIVFSYGVLPALIFYFFLIASFLTGLKKKAYLAPQIALSFIFGLFIVSLVGAPFDNVRFLWYLGVYMGILINYNSQSLDVHKSQKYSNSYQFN